MRFEQNILNLALDPVVNFGKVTVSTGYLSTDTTPIILNTGDGAKLPDTSTGSYNLVWWNWSDYPDPSDDPNVEIVRVLTKSGDALSIIRSQEGTTASNKNLLGRTYKMILAPTQKIFTDIPTDAQSRVDTHSALTTGTHGVGSDTIDGITARNTAISTHSTLTTGVHGVGASTVDSISARDTAISTHAALISSVHNFDVSGNAPPQIHGTTAHDSTTVDGGTALSSATQIPLHDSARHTGTIGLWSQIDKTTSDIADITTKSHTSLTDIGTSTHSQIDTHISAIMAHGVSAGLDASKPALPIVGQRYLAVDTNKDYECYANNIWTDVTATHAALTANVHNFDASGNAPAQTHDSSRHTGTIGSWGQIDKTTSNIADITTKSHASLTDGIISGTTNSHGMIDTHVSSYTNIHGISTGLDANKPASPILGQRYIATDTNKDYECYVAGTWREVTATHAALTASVHHFDASGNAPPTLHGLASHTGTIGDHQGNLSGIGTKTHSDIDAHIASNVSVHNFDSSGNAPPALHAKAKHDSSTVDGGAALSSTSQIPAHGSSQHAGTIGTWGQIDKTTSSIADLTTRNHGSLTDGVISGTTNSHATIDTAIVNSTSHIAATTGIHGTTGNLVATGASVSGQYNSAKYTTTTTLNWNNGNVQYIVLGNGGNTFSFASPRDGGRYMIILKQPASGAAGTVTWPGSVVWPGATAPTLTTTNGKVDIVTFVYDGTNTLYYGGTSLNY